MKSLKQNRLFTPGPLNCADSVKEAMLVDLGSREDAFIELVRDVRAKLLRVAGLALTDGYTAVPMQGSGTFGLESALATLVSKESELLVLENGAYGQRLVEIANRWGMRCHSCATDPTLPVSVESFQQCLQANPSITHVAMVHCETTTGVLNPVEEVATIVKGAGKVLIIDAMSSFGALDLDLMKLGVDCLISSANKCLESVPGFSFVLVREALLSVCAGHCKSLSLDLYAQWQALESNGQFRFTPPTHAMLACDRALDLFLEAGGVAARGARYRENHRQLMDGMRSLGLRAVLDERDQGPIITAFHCPDDAAFDFESFYQGLAAAGQVIYPGKLVGLDCFRIGTIGQLGPDAISQLLGHIRSVLVEMGLPVPLPSPSL